MRKLKYIGLTLLGFWLLASFCNTYAHYQGNNKDNKNKAILKTAADPSLSVMDINNITCFVQSDGLQPPILGGQSFNGQIPKGSNLGAIYQEGILWGGIVNDGQTPAVRVGGTSYSTGNKALTRLFRVRPDYATADLSDDAANFFQEPSSAVTSGQISQIRDQYAKDWQEWPGDLGAPYKDVNNDGKYEPDVDIPGVPGASQTMWISYDDSYASTLYASPPIGMQVQETFWAYAIANPLGNVIFKKVTLYYSGTDKSSSNSTIDSMYIAQFADPDVGQYTDDYAGSDTALNMGYAYNSTVFDAKYSAQGLIPPAVGYDFLQGAAYKTGNDADSAIVNFKWRKGYKYFQDKPMSGFIYFAAGGNWSDPTLVSNNGNYDNGTLQMYNLFRGYLPSPQYPASQPFPRPAEFGGPVGGFGTFLVDGDPVAGTGWLDGQLEPAGDRRILCINGPISMSLHDTVEIVLAEVAGIGSNNLTSVQVMKYNDVFAQYAYDNLFNLPTFPTPSLKATALDQKVVLNWGSDFKKVEDIENGDFAGYTFEGYNVYQMNSLYPNDLSKAVKITTFDKVDDITAILDNELDISSGLVIQKPVQLGKNTGIFRSMTITQDYINSKPLIDGQTYYFTVTAYGYNPSTTVPYHALESSFTSVPVVPQSPVPGVRYGETPGDSLTISHSAGTSDGIVSAIVVDPTIVTGDTYQISFSNPEDNSPSAFAKLYTVTDKTTGKALFSDSTLTGTENDIYPILDGISLRIVTPAPGLNHWSFTGTRWVTGVDAGGGADFFFGGLLLGQDFFGSDLPLSKLVPVEMKWVGGAGATTPSDANGWSQGAVYWRSDHYNYHGTGWMPFTVWDITDPNNPVQLNASFVEDANAGSANNQWDMGWNGSAFSDLGGREYIFINDTPYDPNHYNANVDGTVTDVMYAIWPAARGSHPYLEAPWNMFIYPNFPITVKDSYTFTTNGVTKSTALAQNDVNKINVFPNPYYGYQYREVSREDHYVTFSHLPNNATIRIFDLAGVLVRTINKTDNTQFARWDLRNDNNYPVASGIYVAYIDMPDLGKTKILKVAIIQEVQVLPVY